MIRIEFPGEWRTLQHHLGPSEAVGSQKRSENSIFYGFQTQARSHEPIFGDKTLIFGVNVIHWWGIENQNFGGDLMTLPFLRFSRKQGGVPRASLTEGTWESSVTDACSDLLRPRIQKFKRTRY